MANPFLAAGPLNRVRSHIVIPGTPTLNITPQFMGKSFVRIEPEGDWNQQIEVGTGVVNSPEPYIMITITVGILRTQGLAAAWLAQAQNTTILGDVTVYPDTSAFPSFTTNDTGIRSIDPGAFDGTDPIVRLVLRGSYNINSSLWSPT
jgi:hypothetical protein